MVLWANFLGVFFVVSPLSFGLQFPVYVGWVWFGFNVNFGLWFCGQVLGFGALFGYVVSRGFAEFDD